MIGRKNGRMITRLLAWMLTLVVLCTSVPMEGMKVYAEESTTPIIATETTPLTELTQGDETEENEGLENISETVSKQEDIESNGDTSLGR